MKDNIYGLIWYIPHSSTEYTALRVIDFFKSKPVFIDIEDENKKHIYTIPDEASELIPLCEVEIKCYCGDYFFIMNFIGNENKEALAYNVWSIRRPINYKKEIKFLNRNRDRKFAIYLNDTEETLRTIGISDPNIAFNLISLFKAEIGIYETEVTGFMDDPIIREDLTEKIAEYLDIDLKGYKIFVYDYSIDFSQISMEYIPIQNEEGTYIMCYVSGERILDVENNEDDRQLQGISNFMDNLLRSNLAR